MHTIQQIESKLKGLKGKDKDGKDAKEMPLSIEGQVHHLISEATNIDNLALMYIGWAAYL